MTLHDSEAAFLSHIPFSESAAAGLKEEKKKGYVCAPDPRKAVSTDAGTMPCELKPVNIYNSPDVTRWYCDKPVTSRAKQYIVHSSL